MKLLRYTIFVTVILYRYLYDQITNTKYILIESDLIDHGLHFSEHYMVELIYIIKKLPMTTWKSIAWRNNNDWIDFYETPKWCIEELLKREDFEWNILEPASWSGAISKILIDQWYDVISKDIREDDQVFWQKGKSIFDEKNIYDNVITNPPYCIAKDFISKSLEISRYKICMFLKLQFLESIDRYKFFQNTPLRTVYVFCKRPTLYPWNWPEPKK